MLEHTFPVKDSEMMFLYAHLLKLYLRWLKVKNLDTNRIVSVNIGCFVWNDYMPPRLAQQYPTYQIMIAKTTFSVLKDTFGDPLVDENGSPYWKY